jgi:hypothetical protein
MIDVNFSNDLINYGATAAVLICVVGLFVEIVISLPKKDKK